MRLVPITLREAKAFVDEHHRHNEAAIGWKFGVGLQRGRVLVGVAIAGRPVSRVLQECPFTIEVTRTCTDGTRNANSMLYGAIWRAARALGYTRGTTYTQADESGASLRAVGWTPVAELPVRKGWADSSVKLKHVRKSKDTGGVARVRWEIRTADDVRNLI